MNTVRYFLIVSGRGEARLVRRRPISLRWDEVGFPLDISVPSGWGRLYDVVSLTLPEAPDVTPPSLGRPLEEEPEETHVA